MNDDFTDEELQALKDIAKDRIAVSRLMGKIKTLSLTITGILAAYIALSDHFWTWVKVHLGLN